MTHVTSRSGISSPDELLSQVQLLSVPKVNSKTRIPTLAMTETVCPWLHTVNRLSFSSPEPTTF